MKKINTLVFIVVAFIFSLKGDAQVEVRAVSTEVSVGSLFNVQIVVENWTDVATAQWSMHWDDNMVEFQQVNSFYLQPGNIEEIFGFPPTTDNRTLTFSWYSPSTEGISIDGGTILFELSFVALPNMSGLSEVVFDGMPTLVELTDENGSEIDVNFINGSIDVGTNGVTPLVTNDFELGINSPNPWTDVTSLSLVMSHSENVILEIFSSDGRHIHKRDLGVLGVGEHSILIDKESVGLPGVYFCKISTKGVSAIRKMTRL